MFCARERKLVLFLCEVSRVGQMLEFVQCLSVRVYSGVISIRNPVMGVCKRKPSAGGNECSCLVAGTVQWCCLGFVS